MKHIRTPEAFIERYIVGNKKNIKACTNAHERTLLKLQHDMRLSCALQRSWLAEYGMCLSQEDYGLALRTKKEDLLVTSISLSDFYLCQAKLDFNKKCNGCPYKDMHPSGWACWEVANLAYTDLAKGNAKPYVTFFTQLYKDVKAGRKELVL